MFTLLCKSCKYCCSKANSSNQTEGDYCVAYTTVSWCLDCGLPVASWAFIAKLHETEVRFNAVKNTPSAMFSCYPHTHDEFRMLYVLNVKKSTVTLSRLSRPPLSNCTRRLRFHCTISHIDHYRHRLYKAYRRLQNSTNTRTETRGQQHVQSPSLTEKKIRQDAQLSQTGRARFTQVQSRSLEITPLSRACVCSY